MGDSIFDVSGRQEFAVEYPEREARLRKRPAATQEPGDGQEELSPGLVEVLSKLNVGDQPSSSTLATSTSSAPQIYEEVHPESVMAYIDRGLSLPEGYAVDRLVSLVRDPEWVFTYWELTGETLKAVKAERGDDFVEGCAWVMRIYRVDENMAADVEVDPQAGGWYIHVGRPGQYVFEMALLSPEGEWVSLVVSSMLGAPYAGVSERIDEVWRLTPEAEAALNGALKDALELESTSSRGGSRSSPTSRGSSGALGSSRLRSSLGGVVSSGAFMGASGQTGRSQRGIVRTIFGGQRFQRRSRGQLAFWRVERQGAGIKRFEQRRRVWLDGRALRSAGTGSGTASGVGAGTELEQAGKSAGHCRR